MLLKLSNRLHYLSFIVILMSISNSVQANRNEPFFGADQLDNTQLVDAVLATNPSIEAMRAAWQAAQYNIEQTAALDDPMLSYTVAPETRNINGRDFGQNIQLSQKLPWPGKLELREDSARLNAVATEENVAVLRLHLIESASKIYADWYYIHEALRINDVNQSLWKEFRTIAELKYSTGRASKQDALRAQVQQAMLEHEAITLQRKKRNILARINTLLNRKPDAPVPLPAGLAEERDIPDAVTLRNRALSIHPALKSLNAQYQSLQAKQELAERDYFPDFTVSAGYNSLWDLDEKRFTVGVGINLPLYNGKRDARVGESRSLAQQTRWKINDKQAEIAGSIQRAWNMVNESRHVVKLYRQKLLPLADETLQAAKSDYQSGKSSFLDLVNAEKDLIMTQLNHLKAQTDYHWHLAMLAARSGDPGLLSPLLALGESK